MLLDCYPRLVTFLVVRAARERKSQIDGTMFCAKAGKRRLSAAALFHDCSIQLERGSCTTEDTERPRVRAGEKVCRRWTQIWKPQRTRSPRRIGRRGTVGLGSSFGISVRDSRKSICGAKFGGFVQRRCRTERRFLIDLVNRGDRMAGVLSELSVGGGQSGHWAGSF